MYMHVFMLAIAGQMAESNEQTFFEVTPEYPSTKTPELQTIKIVFFSSKLNLKIPRAMPGASASIMFINVKFHKRAVR